MTDTNSKKRDAYKKALKRAQNKDTAGALNLAENFGFLTYDFGQVLAEITRYSHKDNTCTLLHVLEMIDTVCPAEYFLTNNGNIMRLTPSGTATFHNVAGDFLRMITYDEAYYLSGELQPISFPSDKTPNFEESSKWIFLWKTISSDFQHYKAETCCNGGDYAYYVTTHYFARLTRKGWQFTFIDVHTTSAEFAYDEFAGSFQSNVMPTHAIDTEQPFNILTQSGEDFSLSQAGKACDLSTALWTYDVINDPSNEIDWAIIPHTYSKMKSRVFRLREIGFSRPSLENRKIVEKRKRKRR